MNCLIRKVEAALECPNDSEDPSPADLVIKGGVEKVVQEAVCMSALLGNNQGVNSILVKGSVKNRNLALLFDFGSTHSLIDVNTVKVTGHHSSGYLLSTGESDSCLWELCHMYLSL